jgi:hypothetical protein
MMKTLIAILIWLFLMPTIVMAQTKRDINGFFPGMPKVEFEKKFRDAGCSANPCTLSDGKILFIFTEFLNPPVLREVQFIFQSKRAPLDMISSISKQFGTRAATFPERNTVSVLSATANPYGGTIATWDLTNGVSLRLFVKGFSGDQYWLILSDRKIESADNQAKQRADRDQKAKERAANPAPKF